MTATKGRGQGERSRGRSFTIIGALLAVAVLGALLFRQASGDELATPPSDGQATATATSQPTVAPESTVTRLPPPPSAPVPTVSELSLGLPDIDGAWDIEVAPLGTYVVARDGAGIRRSGEGAPLEIPVYETPFGPPRTLRDLNAVDSIDLSVRLINDPVGVGPLVLRVIAGGPDDDWLMVQAPIRPHDRFVWVRRGDFDFGATSLRIDIDLAGQGELVVYDDEEILLRSGIVQGRDSRPTPTHLTYIERGIPAQDVSPAYGTAIIRIASFSEVLGSFGGGVPSNFIHGTNQPELMGERVSSGEIRLPNKVLDELVLLSVPGTPVLLFDSSGERPDRSAILSRPALLATTTRFLDGGGPSPADATSAGAGPSLWRRCELGEASGEHLLCSSQPTSVYMVAKADAGVFDEDLDARVIPVFDEPGGDERMLVFDHPASGGSGPQRFPLVNPGRTGQPLVLWPIHGGVGDEWVLVQAPVLPKRQAVWVRGEHFDFFRSDVRIEIDIAGPGELLLFSGGDELFRTEIVSGRETRPTPLGATIIDQIVAGERLSPAYGPFVVTYPIYSEALGTFGGGLYKMAIHGTNQPELMGQRVSSGTIRVANEALTEMVGLELGLIGARVVVFDSTGRTRAQAMAELENQYWTKARTTAPDSSMTIGLPIY